MTAPTYRPIDPDAITRKQKADLDTRLWNRLDKTGDCWVWPGGLTGSGYGQLNFMGIRWVAHRLAWSVVNGTIPPGMLCCHTCDNRKCCRPDHIFIGTPLDNNLDAVAKNRHPGMLKTHCIRGHEYNATNTIVRPDGSRNCHECQRWHSKAHYARKVEAKKRAAAFLAANGG